MLHLPIVTSALFLGFAVNQLACAQLIERTDERGGLRFSDQIVGTWETDSVHVVAASISRSNDALHVFTANTWIIHSTNGDQTFELSDINQSADPVEVSFVNVNRRSLTFDASIRLEGEKLLITRDFGSYPRGIVYTLKKTSKTKASIEEARIPLKVRLIDESNRSELVDVTVKPFHGGKLRYSSERLHPRAELEYAPKTGTVILGTLEDRGDGSWAGSLIMELGTHVDSSDPQTAIVRSEKLQLTTVVTIGKTVRIKCGADRTCELTLE